MAFCNTFIFLLSHFAVLVRQSVFSRNVKSALYTYHFSRFDMFVHYFVNYFARLQTNHYTLLTISPISFIFDSARNLTNCVAAPSFTFCKNTNRLPRMGKCAMRKLIVETFYEMPSMHFSFLSFCQHFTSRFSHFANIFLHSRQFDDKCIAG